jgi:hypothetical protein
MEKLLGIKSQVGHSRGNLSSETCLEIHRLYSVEKLSTREISIQLGLNQTTIPKVIRRLTGKPLRKYAGDKTYFDQIDTRMKAYFLGFIAADGCIVDNSNTSCTDTLAINIHKKDACILEKFRQELNRETELYIVPPPKSQVSIRINNQHICDSLRRYGLDYRKSLTMPDIFNLIPREFHDGFIQGYFEGDGWVHQNTTPHKPSNKIYKFATIGFCGTQEFLQGLATSANLTKYAIRHQKGSTENSTNGIFTLTFASKLEINKIFHFMYDTSTFFLNRKYSKFLPYIE